MVSNLQLFSGGPDAVVSYSSFLLTLLFVLHLQEFDKVPFFGFCDLSNPFLLWPSFRLQIPWNRAFFFRTISALFLFPPLFRLFAL